MRLLKKKIELAMKKQIEIEQKVTFEEPVSCSMCQEEQNPALNLKSSHPVGVAPEPSRAIKNMVKNFGRAICTFASSRLAIPYLTKLAALEGAEIEGFIQYTKSMKDKIVGLNHFRSLLLHEKNEDYKTVAYKRLFQGISEVFIKYFSVNWIFDSKVKYKQAHLRFRFKILRRIQNPERFTYLQTSFGKNDTK